MGMKDTTRQKLFRTSNDPLHVCHTLCITLFLGVFVIGPAVSQKRRAQQPPATAKNEHIFPNIMFFFFAFHNQ